MNQNQTQPKPTEAEPDTEKGLGDKACFASSRVKAMMAARKRHLLATHPHLQAEAIANHYSSLAMMALDLRRMVELRKSASIPTPEADLAIKYACDKFAEHHLEDFGVELSWPIP